MKLLTKATSWRERIIPNRKPRKTHHKVFRKVLPRDRLLLRMDNLNFKVACHSFRLVLPSADEWTGRLGNYLPFLTAEEADCLFTLRVTEEALPSVDTYDEIGQFDCGGANHGVYRDATHYSFHISDVDGQLSGVLSCTRDFSDGRIRLYGDAGQQVFALNNALMILFAFSAAAHSTLLVHASVVACEGKGYLFFGKSGTGKSTHSRLWLDHIAGTWLLNDDNPVVRCMDGEARVFGSPWSGKTPCYVNETVPIGAITRLAQFPQNIIRREPSVGAFASVLSSCSTMIWDKPTYDAICNTVTELVGHVPVYFLKCLPDEEAARLCHTTVQ